MRQKTFDLPDVALERLALEAKRRGISQGELLRRMVDESLDRMGAPWPTPREQGDLPLEEPQHSISQAPAQHQPSITGGTSKEGGKGGRGKDTGTTEATKEGKLQSSRVSSPPPPEIPPDLETPEWRGAVRHWLEYKAERGQRYKPRGLESLWQLLRSLGPRVGVPSIHRSAGSRWQGIKALTERELRELAPAEPIPSSVPEAPRYGFAPKRAMLADKLWESRESLGAEAHARLGEMLQLARGSPDLAEVENEINRLEGEAL